MQVPLHARQDGGPRGLSQCQTMAYQMLLCSCDCVGDGGGECGTAAVPVACVTILVEVGPSRLDGCSLHVGKLWLWDIGPASNSSLCRSLLGTVPLLPCGPSLSLSLAGPVGGCATVYVHRETGF